MEIFDTEVIILTDQGKNTGIGRFGPGLIRVLKPVFPNIKLYSLAYFEGSHNINSIVQTKYYASRLYQVPWAIFKNNWFIRKNMLVNNKNLHIIGSDYSLSTESRNVVMTIHEYYYTIFNVFQAPSVLEKAKEVMYNANEMRLKFYSTHAREIVANSESTSKQIRLGLGRNSTVVYIPVDKSRFLPRDKLYSRIKLKLPTDKTIILNVSGGGSNKNIQLLASILKLLPENVIMIKIGYPIYSERCINLKDVSEESYPLYFNAADVYLNSSTAEGLGLPLLESLASGLPIISTRYSTALEVLGEITGTVVKDNSNPSEFAEILFSIIDSKENRELSEKALLRSQFFSDERARNSLLSVYKNAFGL